MRTKFREFRGFSRSSNSNSCSFTTDIRAVFGLVLECKIGIDLLINVLCFSLSFSIILSILAHFEDKPNDFF